MFVRDKVQIYIVTDGKASHFFVGFTESENWYSSDHVFFNSNAFHDNKLMGAFSVDEDGIYYMFIGVDDDQALSNVKGMVIISDDFIKVKVETALDEEYNAFVDTVEAGFTPFYKPQESENK